MNFAPPRALVVFVTLAALVVVANARTLTGGFVYDDQILPGHPMLDGWEDAISAFAHTSEDYLSYGVAPPSAAHGVTYRPLPMVSFAVVNAAIGPVPWAHHLVSLAFHLLVLYLLVRFAAPEGRVSWPTTLLLGTFAAHPALVEAYGWINGRSDVMAAAPLVGLALVARKRR